MRPSTCCHCILATTTYRLSIITIQRAPCERAKVAPLFFWELRMQPSTLHALQKCAPAHFRMQHLGYLWGSVSLHIYPNTSSVHTQQWLATLEKCKIRAFRRSKSYFVNGAISKEHSWIAYFQRAKDRNEGNISFGKIDCHAYAGYWQSHQLTHTQQAKHCAQYCLQQVARPDLIYIPKDQNIIRSEVTTYPDRGLLRMHSATSHCKLSIQQTQISSTKIRRQHMFGDRNFFRTPRQQYHAHKTSVSITRNNILKQFIYCQADAQTIEYHYRLHMLVTSKAHSNTAWTMHLHSRHIPQDTLWKKIQTLLIQALSK